MEGRSTLSKVPAVTLGFWVIKIAATTLGETAGDTVTMTMNLGYFTGTAIFLSVLVFLVIMQIAAKKFHPLLYWATIVASTTCGTTAADFADRSLGIGYTGGSSLLLFCVLATLGLWYWSEGTVSVATASTPKVEAFYWATITFSQTLGTGRALIRQEILRTWGAQDDRLSTELLDLPARRRAQWIPAGRSAVARGAAPEPPRRSAHLRPRRGEFDLRSM